MTTLDQAGTAGPDTLAGSGRLPAGPPTWMPFLLASMAIGRLGAVPGYGGSWLAVDVFGLCLLSARRVPWPAQAGGSR
jgi:hypothetical protein